MMSKVFASMIVAAGVSFSGFAQQNDRVEQNGEALAWTVAAYGSCESRDLLQKDFRKEAAALESDFSDILAALKILAEADNVCGTMNAFAVEMRELATTDMTSFEAKLMTFDEPPAVLFAKDEPEGSGEIRTSVILEASNIAPPLSSDDPQPTSDYDQ